MSSGKDKIGDKIDFPIELDLTEIILNHEFPMEYDDLPDFVDIAPPSPTPVIGSQQHPA